MTQLTRSKRNQKNNLFGEYIIFGIICFVIFLFVKKSGGDDTNFSSQIQQTGYFRWLIDRYPNWSGRIFSDAMAGIFLNLPLIFWSGINAIMATLLTYSIGSLVDLKNTARKIPIIFGLFGYLTLGVIVDSALWVTGSFNYLWTAALGAYSLLIMKKICIEQSPEQRKYILLFLTGILASFGVEQVPLCLIGFSIYFICKKFVERKKLSKILCLYTVVIMACTMISLLSPGNRNRIMIDTKNWLPGFARYSLLEKMLNGLSFQIDFSLKFLFPLLVLMAVFVCLYQRKRNNDGKWILSILNLGLLFYLLLIKILHFNQTRTNNKYYLTNLLDISTIWEIIPYFIFCVVIVLLIILTFDFYKNKLGFLFIWSAIILSPVPLYFSPTIFASGARSFFIPSILIVYFTASLFRDNNYLNKHILKLFLIFPLINMAYLSYWIICIGFHAHIFQ
jgi:hypothetical protein